MFTKELYAAALGMLYLIFQEYGVFEMDLRDLFLVGKASQI